MKLIPETNQTLVLRTDFSDDATWDKICTAIINPISEFRAYVDFISDHQYNHITIKQLISLLPQKYNHLIIFLIDETTITQSDYPILVVGLHTKSGQTFRVIPSELWGVENNLSIGNMDFEEFSNAVDGDGIFRGFPNN
jgi:hypothetical protein